MVTSKNEYSFYIKQPIISLRKFLYFLIWPLFRNLSNIFVVFLENLRHQNFILKSPDLLVLPGGVDTVVVGLVIDNFWSIIIFLSISSWLISVVVGAGVVVASGLGGNITKWQQKKIIQKICKVINELAKWFELSEISYTVKLWVLTNLN